ncbi:MAG: hypothetical protein A2142_06500 [candidate division Zixibacteria bacterium RBG_16_48_11]|nr:MAG: hypothetical protein A2142_06500 [candidate division Zixibacteria bacterium RBG_16_48_11]
MDSYKEQAVNRLKKIQGQLGGLEKMFSQDRYCIDILTQISAVQEALRGVSKQVMQNYLETCATGAIRSKSQKKRDRVYQELMDVIYKYAK